MVDKAIQCTMDFLSDSTDMLCMDRHTALPIIYICTQNIHTVCASHGMVILSQVLLTLI